MIEELTPIPGYEGLYSITRKGRVYSHTHNTFLRPTSKQLTYGHPLVRLYKDGQGMTYSPELLVKWIFENEV